MTAVNPVISHAPNIYGFGCTSPRHAALSARSLPRNDVFENVPRCARPFRRCSTRRDQACFLRAQFRRACDRHQIEPQRVSEVLLSCPPRRTGKTQERRATAPWSRLGPCAWRRHAGRQRFLDSLLSLGCVDPAPDTRSSRFYAVGLGLFAISFSAPIPMAQGKRGSSAVRGGLSV